MLFGFGIGGLIGWNMGKKKEETGTVRQPERPADSQPEDRAKP